MHFKHIAPLLMGVVATSAADITIENTHLSVTAKPDENAFSVESKAGGGLFLPRAKFFNPVKEAEAREVSSPTWGKGKEILVTHEDGSETSIRLFGNSRFLGLHTSVHNPGKQPLAMKSLDVLDMDIQLGKRELMSYGTAGLASPEDAKGSYTFHAYVDPETRNGVVSAWLTHDRGVGVFFPRAGVGLKTQLDFGHYQVKPGASRPTDVLLIGYFDDARAGLESYASGVAAHYDIKLKPKPGVYCTWYHSGASDENKIAQNTEYAEKNLKPFGLDVMQIDDKWQAILPKGFKHEGKIKKTGPIKVFVDTNPNYAKGMAHTAQKIRSHGMVAGIWFMPFAGNFRNPYFDPDIFAKYPDGSAFHDARWSGTCIDMTHPKAQAFVHERVKRIYDWGYRYFKIDGMHTGMPSYNVYVNTGYTNKDYGIAKLHDPYSTYIQAYRKGLTIIDEAGPEAFVLGCNVSQNMRCMGPAFGLIDAMRIGPDNGGAGRGSWGAVTKGAWHGSNLYFLNGRIWHNDPDPVYVRPSNPLACARWMCSWLAVSGAMHTSSEQYDGLPADRLDLLKRCLPGHDLPARPIDLFETDKPRIWLVRNDRMSLIGLFNWTQKEADEIVYDMGKLGLDKSTTYVAFDFWENKFAGAIKGMLKETLPGGTCRILALKPETDHPQLLSTSRHVTQGLMDVVDEKWEGKTLSGTSRVVGNDPYELRIALPANGNWKVVKADADGADVKIVKTDEAGTRVTLTTTESRDISWKVSF